MPFHAPELIDPLWVCRAAVILSTACWVGSAVVVWYVIRRNGMRWQFALATWLALPAFYVAGTGPAQYAYTRGWLTREPIEAVYDPLWEALPDSPEPQMGLERYMNCWLYLAQAHNAAK